MENSPQLLRFETPMTAANSRILPHILECTLSAQVIELDCSSSGQDKRRIGPDIKGWDEPTVGADSSR
jgi:hypothetical protein